MTERTIERLQACHIPHVCAMAEAVGMMPNYIDHVDFLRKEKSCEFVGLFEKKKEEEDASQRTSEQQALGVVCLINDGRDGFYLSLLIVDGKYRRQGIGEQLVRWSIEKSKAAKEKPKMLCLAASKMGYPLYKRIGFESFAFTRLYKMERAGLSRLAVDATHAPLRQGTAICSFFVDNPNKSPQEESLWKQALEMISASLKSTEKTLRFTSLVQSNTVHLLYEVDLDSEGGICLLAWCAVALFSLESRVIGPIFGLSGQDVADVTVRAPRLQLETEQKHHRSLIDAKDGGTFYLHTDSQSKEEDYLARALEQNGWAHDRTIDLMQYDLGTGENVPARPASGPRQFALGDLSQG